MMFKGKVVAVEITPFGDGRLCAINIECQEVATQALPRNKQVSSGDMTSPARDQAWRERGQLPRLRLRQTICVAGKELCQGHAGVV